MRSTASIREALSVAAGSLRGSKLRSFLTLLGIILATTTLIAVMAIIHGMDVYIAQQVSDMGGDGFRVLRLAMIGEFDAKKYLEMQRRNPKLRKEEFDFLHSHMTLSREIGIEGRQRANVYRGKVKADGVLGAGRDAQHGRHQQYPGRKRPVLQRRRQPAAPARDLHRSGNEGQVLRRREPGGQKRCISAARPSR